MEKVISPAWLGFLRGLLTAVIFAVLAFVGDAANLNGILGTGMAALVAGLAAALEQALDAKKGTALFGAVKSR